MVTGAVAAGASWNGASPNGAGPLSGMNTAWSPGFGRFGARYIPDASAVSVYGALSGSSERAVVASVSMLETSPIQPLSPRSSDSDSRCTKSSPNRIQSPGSNSSPEGSVIRPSAPTSYPSSAARYGTVRRYGNGPAGSSPALGTSARGTVRPAPGAFHRGRSTVTERPIGHCAAYGSAPVPGDPPGIPAGRRGTG